MSEVRWSATPISSASSAAYASSSFSAQNPSSSSTVALPPSNVAPSPRDADTAKTPAPRSLKSKRLEELAEEIKRSKSEINDFKGKQVSSVDDDSLGLGKAGSSGQSSLGYGKAINQESLDALLAASISAEEEAKLAGSEPLPTEDVKYEEEGEEDEEEEMIFPINSGSIDPTVLASLPPSMQLDLLDQMRERLMADNRQKYQKIKEVPANFSELQIQSYLKTVAFRREINEVQKCASGRGLGGLQTSRIASEANREYIFSSSFTGDKQMLTPTGAEKNIGAVNEEMRTSASDRSKRELFMNPSKSGDMSSDVATGEFSQDVETYLDERGRVRVSRVRGLGIHMTRDLQRNLDLMKEHEKVFAKNDFNKIPESISYNDASDFPKGQSQTDSMRIASLVNENNSHCSSASIATEGIYEEIRRNLGKSTTISGKEEAAIEISFSEDEIGSKTMVDNFFMNLVSENPTTEIFSESISLEKNKDYFEPEGIWEDGMVGEQNLSLKGDDNQSSFVVSKSSEKDEVLWEEGASLVSHSEEGEKAVLIGILQEEADLKEAIRRSLQDIESKPSSVPVEANMRKTIEDQNSLISVKNDLNIEFPVERDQLQSDVMDSLEDNNDFENPYSRVDTNIDDVPNNSAAFLPTNTSKLRLSIPSSSGAMHDVDHSKICSTEKMSNSSDVIQQLANNDVYKDSSEGLSFSDQTSMQEEDNVAASEANLHDEISLLKQERAFLGDEQRKLERNAESVSSEMFAECQELLQMFGLPYIIAPMEAEAQCAYMEMTNLVDGIVTDDSDVFLFGSRNVYKNIFDDRKYVETYFMKDIEDELGLNRDKLIRMALLLGSDYTEGVSGIGIVNAIEVINGFSEKDGLIKFKEWVESPDLGILHGSQYGGNLNRRSSDTNGNTADGMETNIMCPASRDNIIGREELSDSTVPDSKNRVIFMEKHRNVSKNWHFPPSFPSESVITAYISPQIDESTEPFSWGKPDLPLLRKSCWEKFGWPNQKADDLLVPVLKEYNKHETQLRMEAFYSFNERFAKIRSQRIKKAVKGIAGISSSGLTDVVDGGSSTKKKRGITILNDEKSHCENDTTDRPPMNERKSSKQSRKKAPSRTSPLLSAESFERGGADEERRQIVNTRGRGQVSEIQRGRGRGQCKRGEHLNDKLTKSSDDEMCMPSMRAESMPEMRRSSRRRRQVNYSEDIVEINELPEPDKPANEAASVHDELVTKAAAFGNDAYSFIQEKMSQDHLYSGGGFCLMDESDNGVPPAAESFQGELNEIGLKSNIGSSGRDGSLKEHEEVAHENLLVLEDLDREHTNEDVDSAAQNFLSAMPSLKRKRKRII